MKYFRKDQWHLSGFIWGTADHFWRTMQYLRWLGKEQVKKKDVAVIREPWGLEEE